TPEISTLSLHDALPIFDDNNKVTLEMRVVVGKAMRTQTPVFSRDMSYVVLRPYWNVPRSILRGEIVPAIQRDRSYIAKKRYEVRSEEHTSELQSLTNLV